MQSVQSASMRKLEDGRKGSCVIGPVFPVMFRFLTPTTVYRKTKLLPRIAALTVRRMTLETVAVLDHAELQDGQM